MKFHRFSYVLLAVVFLLTSLQTFAQTLIVPHVGGQVSVRAKYGGKSESKVSVPNWFEIVEQTSTFEEGWQTVTVRGKVSPSEEFRSDKITVEFAAGTTNRFTIEQAAPVNAQVRADGTIDAPFTPDYIETAWLREPNKPDKKNAQVPLIVDNTVSGWLFIRTRDNILHSSWIPGAVARRLFGIKQ